MSKFKLSVCIPVWNQEELVLRALDHIPRRDDVEVLVSAVDKNKKPIIAMTSYTHNMHGFNIEGWQSPWQYFFWNYEITHWMPLPEPPKEDANERH